MEGLDFKVPLSGISELILQEQETDFQLCEEEKSEPENQHQDQPPKLSRDNQEGCNTHLQIKSTKQ